jgi:RHS repeat-associated protein
MVMAGISSKALSFGSPENKFKYNGIELTSELELNLYDAAYRELDPQTARWWQVDPVTDGYEEISPYASMYNNPIQISDPLGNEGQECCKDFFDGVDNALITASGLMNGMVNTLSGGLVSTDPYNFRSKLSSEKQSLYDASVQVGQIGPLIATAGRSSVGEVPALQIVNGSAVSAPITLRPAIVPTSSEQPSSSASKKNTSSNQTSKPSKVEKSIKTEKVGSFTKKTEVRPSKVSPGQSRAEYVRYKNKDGKTIRTYKDSYDRANKFQGRKPLKGGPEGRLIE